MREEDVASMDLGARISNAQAGAICTEACDCFRQMLGQGLAVDVNVSHLWGARGFLQCYKAREMLMARSAECHRSDNRRGESTLGPAYNMQNIEV